MRKLFGFIIMVDGILAALYGDQYLRWLEERLPPPGPDVARWFRSWPEDALRWGAIVQVWLGLWLLRR